jgi:hypothetical protein
MKTLQELCVDIILKHNKFKSFEEIWKVYASGVYVNYGLLRKYVMEMLGSCYPSLIEKFGSDQLIEYFNEEDLKTFKSQFDDILEAKKTFASYKGEIVERIRLPIDQNLDLEGFIPMKYLIEGVEWPSGIDPTKRESYLSPDEFLFIFKITKDEFNQLPNFKKIRLRKEHKLF